MPESAVPLTVGLGSLTYREQTTKGLEMLIWGLAAFVYAVLFFWLGISTLRNGHGWLFFFGIFFPIRWIFGAFARPADPAPQA